MRRRPWSPRSSEDPDRIVATMTATPVDFFFDPGCPFTWRTSRWLTAVEEAGEAEVTWRLMSLSVLNEGREIPEQYAAVMRQGVRVLRALDAAGETGGSSAVAALYTALGTRAHDQDVFLSDDVVAACVAEVGLPDSVAEAVDDPARDASVRSSHDRSQQLVGDDAGSPVLALEGRGFFGPVVVPVPKGEEALDLFRGVRLLAGVSAFAELKTSRNPF